MKFSYNWLKELVDFKFSPSELADLINLHITEVESMSSLSSGYTGVIIAEILEINLHPNADKLHLVVLDIGRGKQVEVVCGASNIEVGQKVPLALVGSKLSGKEIKKAKIRGTESTGMICSGAELGLEEKSSGILVLPANASVGKPANEILDISDDVILDLKILSNRPDYLSYIGIAREISAVLGKPWKISLKTDFNETTSLQTSKKIEVNIKNKKACPYYSARWVGNIEVTQSPEWLRNKLISGGIRPINNLVDISNLVMLETGQPIHIFDASKVQDKKIIVRQAQTDETILTLDGQQQKLNPEVLLIASQKSPLALAGIMGGEISGVNDLTREIIIEIATFNPKIIRRGSKSLGISTDASLRFERGLSSYFSQLAMDRTLHLIQSLIPKALISHGTVKVGHNHSDFKEIEMSVQEINNLLGTKLASSQIVSVLKNLNFSVRQLKNKIKVSPPLFRLDIKELADVVEEIVRIIGINKVEPKIPIVAMHPPAINRDYQNIEALKNCLAKLGFSETPSHSFIGQVQVNKAGIKLNPGLKLINPLNVNWTHLSSSLGLNLLQFISNNQSETNLKLFEINTIFASDSKKILPLERKSMALVVNSKQQDAYRILRGILEYITQGISDIKFVPVPGSNDDKYINILRVISNQHIIGSLEEISPSLASDLGLPLTTVWAEIDLTKLFELSAKTNKKFLPFSQYPISSLDLSVELPISVSVGLLIDDIAQSSILIVDANVFDVYQLENGKRSIGLRIRLQSPNRTLVNHEIKTVESRIINLIITKYRGKIRGSQNT